MLHPSIRTLPRSDVELYKSRQLHRSPVGLIDSNNVFQLRMSEIDDVELLDKRGYLTICVSLVKDGKVYLRKTEGIREWFRGIRVREVDEFSNPRRLRFVGARLCSIYEISSCSKLTSCYKGYERSMNSTTLDV